MPDHAPPVDDGLRGAADRFLSGLIDLPVAERAAALERLQRDDPALFALVDSLSVYLDDVDTFLEAPHVVSRPDEDDARVGQRFGHWQVVRTLGHGGMGAVFEVQRSDGVVRQRAALKLIRTSLDHRTVVARFRTERQILAALDHPRIARLIDGGEAGGRPYLVMEYVDGVPLDRWCAERSLSIDARIALFNELCDAVHYAHQRLVVHRDIKPGNILVTSDGVPKLLDFGVSKLVDPDGGASNETIDASALLTPRYSSPEQIGGAPISTASDVYSLGVVLFELLTGSLPHATRESSLVEVMRAVIHDEPLQASVAAARQSASSTSTAPPEGAGPVAQRLRGDLDHILAKALAREPAARYASAAALRDDLQRHLAGDPIEAVPPRWTYRAGKFMRKHRVAVAIASIVVVAIVGLTGVALGEAYRADHALAASERQRTLAERRFEDTRSLAKAMLFELDDAIASGPTKAREQLVRTAITYLDRLSQDRLSDDLQREVAAGYERIAEILGSDVTGNLGRSAEARDYLLQALGLRQRLVAIDANRSTDLAGLVECHKSLAKLAQRDGRVDEAAAHLDAAFEAAMRRVRLDPDDVGIALKVFPVRRLQAMVQYYPERPSLGHYDESLTRLRSLVDDVEAFGRQHPDVPRTTIDLHLNSYLHDYTQVALQGGHLQVALAAARRSLALSEDGARARPEDPVAARKLMLASDAAGIALLEVGESRAGLALLERAAVLRRKLAATEPDSATAAYELTEGFARMGFAYETLGQPAEALAQFEQWVRHAEKAMARLAFPLHDRLDLATARTALARMQLSRGDVAHALEEARRAESEVLAFDATTAAHSMARQALGESRVVIARALHRSGAAGASLAQAEQGVTSLVVNAAAVPADVFAARALHRARIEAGLMVIDDRALRLSGCRSIATGRDALADLKERGRLSVAYFPLIDRAERGLARCRNR